MLSALRGSTSTAAPPATSSVEIDSLVTTGVPCAIASSTGKPKPSHSDGYAITLAAAYRPPRNRSSTCPKNFTLSVAATETSPQPCAPATTSGGKSARSLSASTSFAKFFRGSSVPTNKMNSFGNFNAVRACSTWSAVARSDLTPRGTRRTRSEENPASKQSFTVAVELHSNISARFFNTFRLRANTALPWRVKKSG